MTVEFRQDFLDGRRLTILSQGIPVSTGTSPKRSASSLVLTRSRSATDSENRSGSPVTKSSVVSRAHSPLRSRSLASGNSSNSSSVYGFPDVDTSLDGDWQRILYRHNPQYPDNYTPPSFLSSLSINRDIRLYEYMPSVRDTLIAVTLTLCLIPVYFVVYTQLDEGNLSPAVLLVVNFSVLVSGYVCREKVVRLLLESNPTEDEAIGGGSSSTGPGGELHPPWTPKSVNGNDQGINFPNPIWEVVFSDMYQGVLVFGSVFVLSPLLRSLTHSWSSASIMSIGITMLIVHVIFHDYGFISRTKSKLEMWQQYRGNRERLIRSWKRVDSSLALNAIIFSAIVLASRLRTAETVFAFLFFAMSAFPFLPFVTKLLYLSHRQMFVTKVVPAMLLTTLGLIPNNKVRLVYAGVTITVVIICPYVLILCLPLKNSIKGPWDIAHVKSSSTNMPPTPTAVVTPMSLTTFPRKQTRRIS